MDNREMELGQKMASALSVLPAHKQEFMLGYAEGVAAMAEVMRKEGLECPANVKDTESSLPA